MISKRSRRICAVVCGVLFSLAVVACGGLHDGHGPGLGVLDDSRFRSFKLLPITDSNGTDCYRTRFEDGGTGPGTGDRPLCANTIWVSSNNTCRITGLKSWNCACYEGQAHACDKTTGGPCEAGAPNCGVRACLVNADDNSVWSACSVL
jgi:hypothetical protein